jgi:guanylate kinase
MSLPVIILIGLTGAGKSTAAQMLENTGVYKRVIRLTTRQPRSDDDQTLFEYMSNASLIPEGGITFQGWGGNIYCVRKLEIDSLLERKIVPVVELGIFSDAEKFINLFSNAKIVYIKRPFSVEKIRKTLLGRGMPDSEISERIDGLFEDLNDIEENILKIDCIIENYGPERYLFEQIYEKISVFLQID